MLSLSEIADEITAAKQWLRTQAASYGCAGLLHSGLIRLESAEIALIEHIRMRSGAPAIGFASSGLASSTLNETGPLEEGAVVVPQSAPVEAALVPVAVVPATEPVAFPDAAPRS